MRLLALSFLPLSLCLVDPSFAQDGERRSSEDAAVDTYLQTGAAPILAEQSGDVLRHPFGVGPRPTLNCHADDLCAVELERGETVMGIASGDPRWITEQLSGPSEQVIVQPTEGARPTTLIITTPRRAYQIRLTADARKAQTNRLTFYYPAELVRLRRASAEQTAIAAERSATASAMAFDPSKLHDSYQIRGRGPFVPNRVLDDGSRTWLRWAKKPAQMPVLLGLMPDGKTVLLNFRIHEQAGSETWASVDGVHDGLELRLDKLSVKVQRRPR